MLQKLFNRINGIKRSLRQLIFNTERSVTALEFNYKETYVRNYLICAKVCFYLRYSLLIFFSTHSGVVAGSYM